MMSNYEKLVAKLKYTQWKTWYKSLLQKIKLEKH